MSQLSLFEKINEDKITLDLFQAYFDARRNKRNTFNALAFERDFESQIFVLKDEILSYRYEPLPSICFVNKKPVLREIFAAHFRDRVVHHFIYNYISPIFEKKFINDSYSCRVGKGTHYAIKRASKFLRSCSENYTKDCYILKLDLLGYFMSINKDILFSFIKNEIRKHKNLPFDLDLILSLIQKTVFNNPTINCKKYGNPADWAKLPQTKSLFHAATNCGLPIGNLTSQLFGNVYLNGFDHWIKKEFKIKYYGRYVDDLIIIHQNKKYLLDLIPKINNYLDSNLSLKLHPHKIYIQHFSKGVNYLGAIIKPHRIYSGRRVRGNFYQAIQKHNQVIRDHRPNPKEMQNYLSSMNSYLGILRHSKSYQFTRKVIKKEISAWWWNYFEISFRKWKFKPKKSKVRI